MVTCPDRHQDVCDNQNPELEGAAIFRKHSDGHFCLVALIIFFVSQSVVFGREMAPFRHPVGEKAPDAFIPYMVSQPLDQANRKISRLLISIHSSGFDAMQYFQNARTAAAKFPGALPSTLIIAPQFFERPVAPVPIPDGLLYWQVSPFRGSGRGAVGPGEVSVNISAFEVMDRWLEELTESGRFPGLRDIVLVGHSAGGQFVQRYAMVGKFEPPAKIRCRYVVSAPSGYAYATGERFNPSTKQISIPDAAILADCPEYNRWGHGLEEPFAYFADTDFEMIAKRYAKRYVFYLCGENDNDPNCETMGRSCGAMLQGRHRLERMQWFAAYLRHHYGPTISRRHAFAVVPGVGHHGLGTMTSLAGRKFLFAPIR
jgi:pimeloyl-ACP methyl ester carboxylesterase